jgi:predicted RNA-binding Zn ribbon-like protein
MPRSGDGDAFRYRAARLSLDLTSTLLWRRLDPIEQLREPADVARWLEGAGVRPVPAAVTEEGLGATRALREAIYRLAHARMAGTPPAADDLAVLNAAAAAPAPAPQLRGRGGVEWASDAPLAAGLAAVARDFIELVTGPFAGRIRECMAEDCAFLFVDVSRPGRRRWCAMNRCGNRHHVREFRARHRPAEHPSG